MRLHLALPRVSARAEEPGERDEFRASALGGETSFAGRAPSLPGVSAAVDDAAASSAAASAAALSNRTVSAAVGRFSGIGCSNRLAMADSRGSAASAAAPAPSGRSAAESSRPTSPRASSATSGQHISTIITPKAKHSAAAQLGAVPARSSGLAYSASRLAAARAASALSLVGIEAYAVAEEAKILDAAAAARRLRLDSSSASLSSSSIA